MKTQSRSLFFSCSTLEPNTEVFSKVSQSLALVNSVSTLLNKGGIACSRPTTSQDFCTSAKQTQTCTAAPFQPCTSRHERKRGSAVTAADKSFRAARTSSEMLTGICSASKAHPMPRKLNKHAKTWSVPCSCLSMHKTAKGLWKLSSSTKCSSQCLKRKNNFTCCSTEPKGKQKGVLLFFPSVAPSRGSKA